MSDGLGYEIVESAFADMVDTEVKPEVLATGMQWAEGPVWCGDSLYFNDIPNKKMHCWREGTGVTVALEDTQYANGNTTDLDGLMVSCVHGLSQVLRRLDPHDPSAVEVVAEHWEGKRLNSPNDVVVKSDGSIWFTDPSYGIDTDAEGYARPSEIGANHVYRVDPSGTVAAVATDFDKPNGLAFSPDESLLYIADSGAVRGASFPGLDKTRPHHIRVFDVNGDSLDNGRVFVDIEPGIPDGLRVDTHGDVWTSAHDGIHCYSSEAKLLGKVLLPEHTANCCFGGASGTDLFIASSSHVYKVRTSRRGAEGLRGKKDV